MATNGHQISKEGEYTNGSHHNESVPVVAPPKSELRVFANPAPLGLSAFALTTFILSLINCHANKVTIPAVVVGCAWAYGGFVQLLAGMWEMAVGNTFGATALSSYGGFWISFAILETAGPQSYGLLTQYTAETVANGAEQLQHAIGFYLIAWWIFTTLLLIATLRTSVVFFLLFFTLDLAFLFLALGRFLTVGEGAKATLNQDLNFTGGIFGLLAAFLAWYCALAGILDNKNSFFTLPMFPFSWSDASRKARAEKEGRYTA